MFDIIGTKEQRDTFYYSVGGFPCLEKSLEAQKNLTLKQLVKWAKEPCLHGTMVNPTKRCCPYCWQELEKEIEK